MIPETGNDYVLGTEPTINITRDKDGNSKKALILTCSSDRGLCGAIHSSVSKVTRRLAAQDREHTQIAVLGDKAKPQVSRDARRNIVMHFNQVGRNIPTFLDALVIWQGIRAAELDFDQVAIIYNRFVSAINFEPVIAKPPSAAAILGTEKLAAYEYEPETVNNLAEYLYVSRLYWALVEGHASEMSSKRTAMENATKNAEAIVVALTMKYNRTRQAVITNELVDIITGASAL
ncbi:ATP synthase subunit gamma [Paramicrosporidium saccamoebae]|uniref:ATP synthase subunit gamma, mitochondrial n=1 Tax=Paramicrosporidium saccamoebae TaxID=1246581 RepID=A0A2H9TJJ9_9FUNG|nr:ATP synthase subunit gamma [Paramicrosporidium saccamoebae]